MEPTLQVEAVLFASGKALEETHIKELCELTPKKTKDALEALQKKYDENKGALFIWNEGSRWKINVKEEYIQLVKSLVAETELERPLLETLAVVAYRQPILQADVIKARGGGAYEHVTELVERGFVTKEKYGRSFKLKLTEKFYNYFDVEGDKDIRELFKDIEVPEVPNVVPEKVGSLDVVEAESDADHQKRREEHQLEIYSIQQLRSDDKKHYLKEFEGRLGEVSERINKAEKDILEQKKASEESDEDSNADEENSEEETTEKEEDPQAFVKKINEEIDEITKKEE